MSHFLSTFQLLLTGIGLTLLAGVGLAATTIDTSATAPESEQYSTLIRLNNDAQLDHVRANDKLHIVRETPLPDRDTLVVLEEPPTTAQVALKLSPATRMADIQAHPNHTYHATNISPNDPRYEDGTQWSLDAVGAESAWNTTIGSADTIVAVIDSGILYNQQWNSGAEQHEHPDIDETRIWENPDETADGNDTDGNNLVDDTHGWDFMGGFVGDEGCPNHDPDKEPDDYIGQDNDPQPYSCDNLEDPTLLNKDDDAGSVSHGTAVASIAAAATDNGTKLAGIDWQSQIMNLRIFDGYGNTTADRVVGAMEYADSNGADVANLSLAFTGSDCSTANDVLEATLEKAYGNDTVPVAASGNDGKDHVCYPASSEYTIAVGATDKNDERAGFSNYGDKLDVVAPGKTVHFLNAPPFSGDDISEGNGTSFSAPHVTAATSLLKSEMTEADSEDIRQIINDSADTVSNMNGQSFMEEYGHGRLNIANALQFAPLAHPDGTLVRKGGDTKVYRVDNSERRHIASREAFGSHGFQFSHVRTAAPATLELPEGSAVRFREGALVQGSGAPVYVINYESGTIQKRHVVSREAFENLDYSFDHVLDVNDSQLPAADGEDIDSDSHHPDGTLVREAGEARVDVIDDGKRQHVKSREVFDSHGFDFSRVRTATQATLDLPESNPLDFREGALIQGDDAPVYVVSYANGTIQKRHIPSRSVFEYLDYSFNQVLDVSDNQLPDEDGEAVE